jgi:hypothetical protein
MQASIPTLPTDTDTDTVAVRAVLGRAVAALAMHTGSHGMCAGCLEAWARLAPFPCEQQRWAAAVIERYGGPPLPTTAAQPP